jgi:hypothetical protein
VILSHKENKTLKKIWWFKKVFYLCTPKRNKAVITAENQKEKVLKTLQHIISKLAYQRISTLMKSVQLEAERWFKSISVTEVH